MTQPKQHEGRPLPGAAPKVICDDDSTIVPPTASQLPKPGLPGYAVFVLRRDDQWSRRLYLSLHAAQKAIDRAKANGIEAHCMLVGIVPLSAAPVSVTHGGGDA